MQPRQQFNFNQRLLELEHKMQAINQSNSQSNNLYSNLERKRLQWSPYYDAEKSLYTEPEEYMPIKQSFVNPQIQPTYFDSPSNQMLNTQLRLQNEYLNRVLEEDEQKEQQFLMHVEQQNNIIQKLTQQIQQQQDDERKNKQKQLKELERLKQIEDFKNQMEIRQNQFMEQMKSEIFEMIQSQQFINFQYYPQPPFVPPPLPPHLPPSLPPPPQQPQRQRLRSNFFSQTGLRSLEGQPRNQLKKLKNQKITELERLLDQLQK